MRTKQPFSGKESWNWKLRSESTLQAKKSLKIQRQRLFSLLNRLPAYVYLQAPDHTIRFANRYFREHFGAPNGLKCHELLRNRKTPCPECQTFEVFETNATATMGMELPHRRLVL